MFQQGPNSTRDCDFDDLTGTETETDDEFAAEDIPASLRSSQLSGNL